VVCEQNLKAYKDLSLLTYCLKVCTHQQEQFR
jgi:hypothetical protein